MTIELDYPILAMGKIPEFWWFVICMMLIAVLVREMI